MIYTDHQWSMLTLAYADQQQSMLTFIYTDHQWSMLTLAYADQQQSMLTFIYTDHQWSMLTLACADQQQNMLTLIYADHQWSMLTYAYQQWCAHGHRCLLLVVLSCQIHVAIQNGATHLGDLNVKLACHLQQASRAEAGDSRC